ncbi:MAG: phosphatase PAP2 family protein [Thomasclavelia sp.]|jgi:undecaprenyl-diphosphatase|nr:phosphatase PAP2 family protein [Thomasclavelia sp.]
MEKGLIKSYKKYYFVIPLFIAIIWTILVAVHCFDNIDQSITNMFVSIRNPLLTQIFKLASDFGSVWFYIVATIIFFSKYKKESITWLVNLGVIQVINRIIKIIIRRPRPSKSLRLVVEHNYSFPSAHAMCASVAYGLLICKLGKLDLKYKRLYQGLLSLVILMILISRVYLGVHYASDVIGGLLFGIAYTLFINYNTSFN